jgi:hypothetical protein
VKSIVRKNQLLDDLRNNRITENEFIKKCAEWALEEVDTCDFKPLPVKPKEVIDFEMIPENVRRNIDPSYFKEHPQILAFKSTYEYIKYQNKVLFDWLRSCLSLLELETDKEKIMRKLGEYDTSDTKGGE